MHTGGSSGALQKLDNILRKVIASAAARTSSGLRRLLDRSLRNRTLDRDPSRVSKMLSSTEWSTPATTYN